jgi:hypothetical protein
VATQRIRACGVGKPSAAWAWASETEKSCQRQAARQGRGVALVPRSVRGSGGDDETTEEEVDALAVRLESLKAKSRSMLAEAASLEKQVVKAESSTDGGGDAAVSETTVIVRSAAEAKKAKREQTADAIASATAGLVLLTIFYTKAHSIDDTQYSPCNHSDTWE